MQQKSSASGKNLFKPETESINTLFRKEVPFYIHDYYQRSYVWKEDNIKDLLEGIEFAMNQEQKGPDKHYFLGVMLSVHKKNQKRIEIVDGQQRLTTLSLIFCVLYHMILDTKEDLTESTQDFSTSTAVTNLFKYLCISENERPGATEKWEDMLITSPRLELSSDEPQVSTNGRHQDWTRTLCNKHRGENSNRFITPYKTIEDYFQKEIKTRTHKFIFDFLKFLQDHVYVVHIGIEEVVNEYQIFEVLNATGKSLTDIELVKNYVMSCMKSSEKKKDEARALWLKNKDAAPHNTKTKDENKNEVAFNEFMAEYFAAYFQMESGKKIETEGGKLYTHIRTRYEKPAEKLFTESQKEQEVFHFLTDIGKNNAKFRRLKDIHKADLKDYKAEDENRSLTIQEMMNSLCGKTSEYRIENAHRKIFFPVLFSMLYKDKDMKFVFESCAILWAFMKRTRILRSSKRFIEAYRTSFAKLAYQICYSDISVEEIEKYLREIDEDVFSNVGLTSAIMNMTSKNPIAKELLVDLAQHDGKAVKFKLKKIHLEHIIPDPDSEEVTLDDWPGYPSKETMKAYREYFGSKTLLYEKDNQRESNNPFKSKKTRYQESEILMTKKLAEIEVWTREEIKERQADLAKQIEKLYSLKPDDYKMM